MCECACASEQLPEFFVCVVNLFEFFFDVSLILRVDIVATGATGIATPFNEPLPTPTPHVGLEYLVLLLKSQGGNLGTDHLPKLRVTLVNNLELLCNQLSLVLFLLFFLFLSRFPTLLVDFLILRGSVLIEYVPAALFLGRLLLIFLLFLAEIIPEVIVHEETVVFVLFRGLLLLMTGELV